MDGAPFQPDDPISAPAPMAGGTSLRPASLGASLGSWFGPEQDAGEGVRLKV